MTAAWRSAVFLAAVLCLAVPLGAQVPPTFSDTTEVTAVEIPVQVLLDGKPVRGLTAENFAVYRDKSRQPVTGFDMVDLASLPGEKVDEVPAPARRHFLLLFDLSFSEPKSILQARAAAKDLLTGLHPADLVAVGTYAASQGPELVLGFTSDRSQIERAIDSLGLPQLVDRASDPLRLILADMREDAKEAADIVQEASEAEPGTRSEVAAGALAKATGDLAVLEQMERAEREIDRADVETLKRKVSSLTRSFTDLAKFLRSVEGRKYVVYLSEGFDSSILTGTRDQDERDEAEASGQAGRVWEVSSEQRFGHGSATGAFSAMLEEFRRADCIIQAVDIGGLRSAGAGGNALGFERTGGSDSLFQMARDTGGDLYENFNDLSAAMGKMLERTGVTYVLTIQPEQHVAGAYHALKVELKGVPRGARIVHRPGYYAAKPFAQRSPTERMLLTAGQVLAGEEGGLVRTSVLAVPLPGQDAASGTADVPVVIEIEGSSLLHLHKGDDVPIEIYVYALDDKGQVRDHLAQVLALDLAKTETRLLQAGLKFYGHLELPPGSYRARVLVRNGRTGVHGLRVVPLEVPALASSGPVLLPPFFPESKGEWLVTREAPRPGRREAPIPFRLGDQPFLPAAMPILGDRETRFALLGYNLADEGDLQVRSQVLTADGREVEAGDVALVGSTPGEEGGADRLELSFRPSELQPGEYLLRVTITNAAGKAGTSTTRFVVAAEAPGERS
ncbi:MAG TPA: VWA domain-containing protein [Thermoanaerobaculia bacterium]|nr:VWA domain-containing protein [Thermoanaerobaculia bacterium]